MTRWISSAALIAAVYVFASSTASAQEASPSDGIRLPDASIATVGDAQSLEVNPAGLGFMDKAELGYGFELASEDLRGVANEAQSYFLAGGTGWLGAGLGAQWLQKPDLGGELQNYRKFTLGTGARISDFGFGFGFNFFGSSTDERLDGLLAVDTGLQLRASEFIGAGLMVRDINGAFIREGRSLPTRLEASVALRFWDGRVVFEQAAQTNVRDRYVVLTPRLTIEPLYGVRAFGRAEFSFTRVGDVPGANWDALFAGMELSLGSIGAQYAATTRRFEANEAPRFSGITAYHWISPAKKRPLIPTTRRWIYVNLDRAISEEPLSGFFQQTRSFLSMAREFERLSQSPEVEGIVLGVGDADLGFAQIWELRRLLRKVSDSGKETIAVVGASSLRHYYLASAADEIWYSPTDIVAPSGLRSRFVSIREGLDKLGVEAQFVRIGQYKSTPEQLVRDTPSPADAEQRAKFLDVYWTEIIDGIAASREMAPDELESLLTASHYPDDAVKAGLVDRLVYPDEVENVIRQEHGDVTIERGFPEPQYADDRWGRGPEIAVVAVDGNIVQGSSGSNPLLSSRVAGSESLARTFERLRKDSRVKAVVIRVDSSGGSAVASDLIYRSIRKLAETKPVVASMGNIAASGGYYVAAGADEIFAAPITTTGSIGIFAGKVNIAQLADRLGISQTSIERGRPTSFFNIYEPWTEEELADLSTSMNYMYRLFLTQAARTRPLDIDEIDAAGRGRVWAGRDAAERKLVDQLGGVMDAVHRAEALAGLERGDAEYRQYTSGSTLGMDVDIGATDKASLKKRVVQWLGLDRDATAMELIDPTTMAGQFVEDLRQAWSIAVLYGPGEALMLPEFLPTFVD
jgi:protease-4